MPPPDTGTESRPLRVLVVSAARNPSLRLLAAQPFDWLAADGWCEQKLRFPPEVTPDDIAWCDVWFGVRSATPLERRLMRAAQRAGRRVIVAIDDNLLDLPRDVACFEYYNTGRVRRALRAILRRADLVATPSRQLLAVLRNVRRDGPVEIAPVPALLLPDQDAAGARPSGDQVRPVVVGYAGGIDGATYLDGMLREPLRQLKQEFGAAVQLEFFGPQPRCAAELGATLLPYESDPAAYRRQMLARRWDIGLAPLFDTPFHRCKFYNKFLEYGAAGIAGVYARMPPYGDVIEDGATGLLASASGDAWRAAIRRLILDSALRGRVVAAARDRVSRDHGRQFVCARWRQLFAIAGVRPAPAVAARSIRWRQIPRASLLRRAFHFVDRFGWSSPWEALRRLADKVRSRFGRACDAQRESGSGDRGQVF